ncbi:hypothetical protein Efla_007868 [Eimeria flavescens]
MRLFDRCIVYEDVPPVGSSMEWRIAVMPAVSRVLFRPRLIDRGAGSRTASKRCESSRQHGSVEVALRLAAGVRVYAQLILENAQHTLVNGTPPCVAEMRVRLSLQEALNSINAERPTFESWLMALADLFGAELKKLPAARRPGLSAACVRQLYHTNNSVSSPCAHFASRLLVIHGGQLICL